MLEFLPHTHITICIVSYDLYPALFFTFFCSTFCFETELPISLFVEHDPLMLQIRNNLKILCLLNFIYLFLCEVLHWFFFPFYLELMEMSPQAKNRVWSSNAYMHACSSFPQHLKACFGVNLKGTFCIYAGHGFTVSPWEKTSYTVKVSFPTSPEHCIVESLLPLLTKTQVSLQVPALGKVALNKLFLKT